MRVSSVAVVLFALVVGGIVYAQSITRSGDSVLGRMSYVEIDEDQGSPTTTCLENPGTDTYQDIPDMAKTFSQGGLLANEAVVNFTANISDNTSGAEVRLLVDNVVQPGGGEVLLLQAGSRDVSWHFITTPINPGARVAKLQWRIPGGNGRVCMTLRSMVIYHR